MSQRPRTPPKPVANVESEQEIAFLKTELFHAGQEIAVNAIEDFMHLDFRSNYKMCTKAHL